MLHVPVLQVVRPPAVAGTFYPSDPAVLRRMVDGFLAEAGVDLEEPIPKALIAPHAGYVYSGPIAASAYARLRAAADRIDRVVVVGPAHRAWVDGIAAPGAAALATPLGELDVDVEALARVSRVKTDVRAHAMEHSVEVQLPFLARVLPRARVVPLVVGRARPAEVGAVLEALWDGAGTCVVVSSDLSHHLPYREARARDEETAARVLALDPHLVPDAACGSAAVNGLLWVARRKGLTPRLLDLRSSGDTAGDRGSVVGYGAFGFYEGDA